MGTSGQDGESPSWVRDARDGPAPSEARVAGAKERLERTLLEDEDHGVAGLDMMHIKLLGEASEAAKKQALQEELCGQIMSGFKNAPADFDSFCCFELSVPLRMAGSCMLFVRDVVSKVGLQFGCKKPLLSWPFKL